MYLDDGEMGVLTRNGYEVLDLNARRISKGVSRIDWSLDEIEKGGFDHFMLKEIFEQPQTIENTMRGRLVADEGFSKLGGLNLTKEELLAIDQVTITACGTSWHSGLIGGMYIEELARIRTDVEYASEFRYRNPIVTDKTLCVVVSQSGETADTLAAMREAKRRGAKTLGLVNVVGSTIAREDDGGIYLHAGPEIGVASTKAFTSQVIALALLTLKLARLRTMSVVQGREVATAMQALPQQIQTILDRAAEIEQIAERFKDATNFLYLGRGYNFPVALEGALKLKEISYIHAEGYPAAEMKHGPIALIDSEMPVVFVAPHDSVFDKVVSNIQEVKARGGRVICITSQDEPVLDGLIDFEIRVPQTIDMLYPILTVIPLQLLAYYIAVKRGLNVDQPRNLAKSVTVEYHAAGAVSTRSISASGCSPRNSTHCFLSRRVVLRCFDEIDEAADRRLEPFLKRFVRERPVGVERLVRLRQRKHVGVDSRAPRCSNGMRSDHSPRLPPTIDGDAESNSACFPLNGCGRKRDAQSTAFFSAPGIDALYSGEAMMNASAALIRRQSACAPSGGPSVVFDVAVV